MVSLFYVAVMALGYADWCVWCLAVHAINLLMLLAMRRLYAGAGRSPVHESTAGASPLELAGMTLTSREATAVIAFSLIMVAGLWAYRSERIALYPNNN